MLKSCTVILLLLCFAMPLSAASKPASLKEVVAALEKGYAGLQDVQADFSQKTTMLLLIAIRRGVVKCC